jgi:hypothetical protein
MLMSSASAPFWGGANRFLPSGGGGGGGGGATDPFLGGDEGRQAFMNGDVDGFFDAVADQFARIQQNVSDLFNKIADGFKSGNAMEVLESVAKDGIGEFMKASKTDGGGGGSRGSAQAIHALLTGAPVGEWHLTIGPPMNPIMMMGNMVCTGAKVEFNDELGPDDFPTEIKATITLEHGMPRDREAIESMFNKGRGRIYSLPKGYEESLSSADMSAVDKATTTKNTTYMNQVQSSDPSSTTAAGKDLEFDRKQGSSKKKPILANTQAGLYSQGYGYIPTKKPNEGKEAPKTS